MNKVIRPWGWYESLLISDNYQVKRLCVNPGQSLSLQSHSKRAEHWFIVKGNIFATVGDNVINMFPNMSIDIPVNIKHRIKNVSKEPAIIIEIQTGEYLGEDDIVRYDDMYGRI